MAGLIHRWMAALLIAFAAGAVSAGMATAGRDERAVLAYRVRLAVDGPAELVAAVKEASRLKSLESLRPASPAILARRIRADERTCAPMRSASSPMPISRSRATCGG